MKARRKGGIERRRNRRMEGRKEGRGMTVVGGSEHDVGGRGGKRAMPRSPPFPLLCTRFAQLHEGACILCAGVRTPARARARACVCVLHLAASTAPPHSPPAAVTTPRPLLPARPASEPAPVRAGPSPPSLCQFLLGPFPAAPRSAASGGQLRRFTPPFAAAHRPAHARKASNEETTNAGCAKSDFHHNCGIYRFIELQQ